MSAKIMAAVLALAASGGMISLGVCEAASPPPGVVRLEQPAMTDYMRSTVGTPDELSPLAPAEARNVHKEGEHWVCVLNGQAMVYNNASKCWEPQHK